MMISVLNLIQIPNRIQEKHVGVFCSIAAQSQLSVANLMFSHDCNSTQ